MKKQHIAILIILCLTLSACSVSKVSIACMNNDEIPAEISENVHSIHNDFVSAISSGNKEDAMAIMGDIVDVANTEWLDELLEIAVNKPVTWNEHYVQTNSNGDFSRTIIPWLGENHEYSFALEALTNKMYVIYSTVTYPEITYLLSNVYYLADGTWNMRNCYLTAYKFHDKNSLELIAKAQELEKADYILPAKIYAVAAANVFNPGGSIMYPNQAELKEEIDRILSTEEELFATMPTINYEDKPLEIFGFDIATTKTEGISMYISYICDTPLTDTEALANEADAIVAEIDNYFAGVTDTFDYILVRAFNDAPIDPEKMYQQYTTAIEV